MNKIITGLTNKLLSLLDESAEIAIEERPFLVGGPKELIVSPRRKSNELEIAKTARELHIRLKKLAPPPPVLTQSVLPLAE